jgi:hypothetical protein
VIQFEHPDCAALRAEPAQRSTKVFFGVASRTNPTKL